MFTDDLSKNIPTADIELLRNNQISKVRYYYHKTPVVPNTFTVCLLIGNDNKILSRGVSICSLQEIHEKERGRDISCGRAVEAMKKMESSDEIYLGDKEHKRFSDLQVSRKLKVKDGSLIHFIKNMSPHVSRFARIYNNDEEQIVYYIPYIHNLIEARKFFKFKSEYMPEPTIFEEELFFKSRKIKGDD